MGAGEHRITLEISFNLTLARLNQICICFTPIFSSCYIFYLKTAFSATTEKINSIEPFCVLSWMEGKYNTIFVHSLDSYSDPQMFFFPKLWSVNKGAKEICRQSYWILFWCDDDGNVIDYSTSLNFFLGFTSSTYCQRFDSVMKCKLCQLIVFGHISCFSDFHFLSI